MTTLPRELLLLTATLMAWFAYAVTVGQSLQANMLLLEITRTSALVLSGMVGVRLLGFLLIDIFIQRVWAIPATALMRLMVYLTLGFVTLAMILKYGLDLNIATLLTTSALLTAIVGLAMQSTLAALFSGLALSVERNIHVGDGIKIENRMAKVEAIGWRSITARRFDNSVVVVPNTIIATTALSLFPRGEPIRVELTVPAPLTAPPALIIELLQEVVSGVRGISPHHTIMVDLVALNAPEGLADYRVRYHTRPSVPDDFHLSVTVRQRVWYAYQRHGIILPRSPQAQEVLSGVVVETPSDSLQAIAEAARWRGWSEVERGQLARSGRRLLFAPNEKILFPRSFEGGVALLVTGEIRLPHGSGLLPDWLEPADSKEPGFRPAAQWDRGMLLALEADLGRAIGPYARIAVHREIQVASDWPTLYRRLATLIRDPADCEAFLQAAPTQTMHDFGPGTVLAIEHRSQAASDLTAVGSIEILAFHAPKPIQGRLTAEQQTTLLSA